MISENELRRLPGRIKKQEIALRKAIKEREQAEIALLVRKARVSLDTWQDGFEGRTANNAESRRELAELATALDPEMVKLRAALADALDKERECTAEIDRLRGVQSNLREFIRLTAARLNGGAAL